MQSRVLQAGLSLALLLVAAWMTLRYGMIGDGQVGTAMSVGLLMLGAWLAGLLFERVHLPKISGYLVFGVAVGPWALALISDEQAQVDLQFISDLAIALIALTAGGEIRLNWLRGQMKQISLITGMKLLIVWAVMGLAVFAAAWYIPGIKDAPLNLRIVLAALTGLVAAANSPAVVIAMISEYQATGPLSRTVLAVTIFKDMLMVVLFATTLAVGRGMVADDGAISPAFLLAVGVQLIGSIVLGGLCGAVMAWYVHRIQAHLVFFVVGWCMLFALVGELQLSLAGQSFHLEPLLLGLAAGLVMQNLWPDESAPLFETVEQMSLPVYCLFFALAGAKLNVGVLIELWYFVLILVAVRAAAVWAAVTPAARWGGVEPPARQRMWLGLIPQAGIALALAALVENAFAIDQAKPVLNLLIGMIAVNQLIGPIGFRYALLSAGEAQQTAKGHR